MCIRDSSCSGSVPIHHFHANETGIANSKGMNNIIIPEITDSDPSAMLTSNIHTYFIVIRDLIYQKFHLLCPNLQHSTMNQRNHL